MKINWKARLSNKGFWLTIIPAIALFVTTILGACGVTVDLNAQVTTAITIVNAVFALLAVAGVVNDPTTENGIAGLSDSQLAMTYAQPKTDATIPSMSAKEKIKKVIDLAKSEVGYWGHASADQLDVAQANPGGLYTKYAEVMDNMPDGSHYFYGAKQGRDWCCVFLAYLFYTIFGEAKCKEMLGHPEKNNYSAAVNWVYKYLSAQEVFTPQVGDICIYGTLKDGEVEEEFSHVGIVVETGQDFFRVVSGNATSASPYSGGGVGTHTHKYGWKECTHFVRPYYGEE